ncbi:MAG: hypothetical protein EXX96DRAFT_614079 [Benjaminiella poitrasii]|nr:MAG: hypothetical protein EXX96DRAFT_614079 [Benjaminiella poitrasii]
MSAWTRSWLAGQGQVITPHSSPSRIVESTFDEVSEVENSDIDLLPLTKTSVLHILKQITPYLEPSNNEGYETLFVTWKIIKSLLVTCFDTDHPSQLQTRIDPWIVWSIYSIINWRCVAVGYVATIGHVCKSHGNEHLTKRVQLLQSMINTLRGRCLPRKVYVSLQCNASMPLNKRDAKTDSQLKTAMLNHCAGTMQDLLRWLRTDMKPIRLVAVDYAGGFFFN